MSTNRGPCPVCKGTTRMPCPDHIRKYGETNGWYGYDRTDDTIDCTNCGAQYMFSRPTGEVRLRPDGTPCVHEYTSETVSNCYHRHVCKNCSDTYHIDSGD